MTSGQVIGELRALASPEQAKASAWFFKTGPGQYGEGDKFIGIKVPAMRRVAARYRELPLEEVLALLKSPIHEHRFTALVVLTDQYRRGDPQTKDAIYRAYLAYMKHINNWDLVDMSAPNIVGAQAFTTGTFAHRALIASSDLWERRIGILATLWFIRQGSIDETFRAAEAVLDDTRDLIQKAAGWMLREAGKVNEAGLRGFLDQHAGAMPRTMLRYALERLPEDDRKHYMARRRL